MDAYTRRRLEIEGYCELGMWTEAQSLLEEFSTGLAERPEILGFLAMLDVAIEFVGFQQPVPAQALEPALIPA
jgi:hypothetical protein